VIFNASDIWWEALNKVDYPHIYVHFAEAIFQQGSFTYWIRCHKLAIYGLFNPAESRNFSSEKY